MGNTSEFNLYTILHCITANVHAVRLDWKEGRGGGLQGAADTLQQGASSCASWPVSVTWLKCLLMCGSVSRTGISVLQKYLSISAHNFSLTSFFSCILEQKKNIYFFFQYYHHYPKVKSGHQPRSITFKNTLFP